MEFIDREESDVSHTASLEALAKDGALPNIRYVGGRKPWQVRVYPFRSENVATIEDAIARAAELRSFREAGHRHTPAESPDDLPLSAWTDALIADKRARGGKRGPLSPRGEKFWIDSLRPWGGIVDPETGERRYESRDDAPKHQRWSAARDARGALLADRPVSTLALWEIEPILQARMMEARSVASYERQGLIATLRLARKRGARFDDRLLELDPIAIPRSSRGHALDENELSFLVRIAEEVAGEPGAHALSLMGTTGARLSELLRMEKSFVDVRGRSWTLPASVTKERREKIVPLMDAEAKLVGEQILESPPSSRFLFTTPVAGTPWRRTNFYDDVLQPARELARETWRTENGLADDAPTPFDRIDNHRLRHTAITLMLRAGLKVELVAQRVGHDDGGALILRTYRHVRSEELRLALDELGGSLLEAVAR